MSVVHTVVNILSFWCLKQALKYKEELQAIKSCNLKKGLVCSGTEGIQDDIINIKMCITMLSW